MPKSHATKGYIRYLDMMDGQCVVQWNAGDTLWRRSAFVSYRHDVSVVRLAPSHGVMDDVEITLNLPVSEGPAAFKRGDSCLYRPELCDMKLDINNELMTLTCAYCPQYGHKGYIAVYPYRNRWAAHPTAYRDAHCKSIQACSRHKDYESRRGFFSCVVATYSNIPDGA
jgi:hypothetical protein